MNAVRLVPTGSSLASVALWAGFFLHGAASVLIGPLIPEFGGAWGVTRADLAILFPAQFFTSSLGAVLSSLRPRRSLVAGYAVLSTGLVVTAWFPWPAPIGGLACVGFGLGLVAAATNLEVARRADACHRGGTLSLLNMVWGLGAVGCPVVFAAARGRIVPTTLVTGMAALVALPALCMLLDRSAAQTKQVDPAEPAAPASPDSPAVPPQPTALGRALGLLPLAGLFFFYVGIEATLGGWLATHGESLGDTASGTDAGLWITAGFWGSLLVGRGLAPRVLHRVTEPRLYGLGLGGALVGLLLLRLGSDVVTATLGALITGFALAPLFPLTVSFLGARIARGGQRQAGWVFAFAGLGGATLPWIAGRLPGVDGSMAEGFVAPLAGLSCMMVLFVLDRRRAEATP